MSQTGSSPSLLPVLGGQAERVGGLRGLARDDRVAGPDDPAAAVGADDPGQRGRGDAGRDDVAEDGAGADGGELVGVAHDDEPAPERDGLEERGGEQGVCHARLVHDNEVRVDRVPLVVEEPKFVAAPPDLGPR
jgi:hypothetical protein